VFESRVLRRIFGPKRDDITGERGRLCNEEVYDLYCFTKYYLIDQIKHNELDRLTVLMGERRVARKILVGKTDGKRQRGRPGFSWENHMKFEDIEFIVLA
jgi:hypothetical protein